MSNYTKKSRKSFTLMEVVIAIAILALSLVAAMSMSYSAKKRIDKAYKNWKTQHMFSQAAEYYLLAGANSNIPDNIFSYEDIEVNCDIQECENLAEDTDTNSGQWFLGTYHIELKNNGKELKSIKIDKIINKNAL